MLYPQQIIARTNAIRYHINCILCHNCFYFLKPVINYIKWIGIFFCLYCYQIF
uniref:LIM domain-containing protein n=1 Tax=Anaerosacchariphilus polymeriproducens TaxID=1812858 RepID=UPI0038BADFC3